jgi:rhamnosyltransferase
MPLVSIIMLIKNAEPYLEEILQAINNQLCDFSYESLLIDSGSKDRSKEIAKEFAVRLISIPPETFNHGETRNFGLRESSNDSRFAVYITQDATPFDDRWLQYLVQPMLEDAMVAGVCSRHIPRNGASVMTVRQLVQLTQTGSTTRIVKQMPNSKQEYHDNRIYYVWFSNTSSAIRKAVWEHHHFRDVDFAEDAVWADDVLRSGYKIVYEPSSAVVHSHDYSLIEQFRQNVDHQYAMYRLFQPVYLRDNRNWLKLFAGIPLQTWRDYQFAFNSTYFKDQGLFRKIKQIFRSPFWHFATISGGFMGAYLDEFPDSLSSIVSRQERIKHS